MFVKFIVKVLLGSLAALLVCIIALVAFIFIDLSFNAKSPNVVQNQINDVTQLNPVTVSRTIKPKTTREIIDAIQSSNGFISIGGGKNSQSGQTAFPNSLHIDMRDFNKVLDLNAAAKRVTVQSGITWRKLQEEIDKKNLSVKIMQTYANFTVGGSLSVNVHGRYVGEGPMIRSIHSFKIVLADGREKAVTPESQPELFYGVIGGYGSLGVVTEVTLKLEQNQKVQRYTQDMNVSDYREFFFSDIRDTKRVVFHNADLFPPHYNKIRSVSWLETDAELTEERKLIPVDEDYWWQPRVANFVASYDFGKWLRQYVLEPILYSFDAVQWRNYEASYDIRELEPKSRQEYTYALREYFVPVAKFDDFVPQMAEIFQRTQANIINVSIRHALPDSGSYLAWAPEEVFAFVVYYRQGTDQKSRDKVATWSREMIDAALSVNGRYYLPYQLHATKQQFEQAYPNVNQLREAKRKYDPDNRFTNLFVEKYLVPQS